MKLFVKRFCFYVRFVVRRSRILQKNITRLYTLNPIHILIPKSLKHKHAHAKSDFFAQDSMPY